jgi:predicted short-subunit dehydrogenase-like oxidoreductase (DUF2520 family)
VVGTGKAAGSLMASLAVAGLLARQVSPRGPLLLRDVDVVLVAVRDHVIAEVAAQLDVDADVIVAHVAGSRGRVVLPATLRRGVFHPLASLDGTTAVPPHTLCATDGDDDDVDAVLQELARALQLVPHRVRDDDRVRYHAGAVLAGNLATALLQLGIEQLVQVGIDVDVARTSLARLLLSTAERAIAAPLALAATGPVARGDVETVRKHLEVLDDTPDVALVYRRLSRVLVQQVRPTHADGLDWSLLDD